MTTLSEVELSRLRQTANRLRQHTVAMLTAAQSGHSAGPLGMAEIMTALYFSVMRHDPKRPDWEERDVFFLSNGHTAPVLYAALAEAGYFPTQELGSLRRFGSRLQGHPERGALPGLESTSGPLGEGLSQAAGYAYALKYLKLAPRRFCYVVMGDGELNEGNVWEAAMFASKYGLGQLIALIDRNYIQIDGSTEDVMPLDDLAAKWRAFGWHTLEIDGNDVAQVVAACHAGQAVRSRPSVIIAHTVAGAGVDFMEYDHRWHGKAPNREEAEAALAQLSEQEARL